MSNISVAHTLAKILEAVASLTASLTSSAYTSGTAVLISTHLCYVTSSQEEG